MHYISILTDNKDTARNIVEWTRQFYEAHCSYPVITAYEDVENFWRSIRMRKADGVIIDLPDVAGLNAVEHLRSLHPECGLIWCSNMDFSLHAFRIRADYFILVPITEKYLCEALSVWLDLAKHRKIAL